MDWVNFHHLRYVWLTAREGSLTKASRRLRLSASTLSTQIKTFEEAIGTPLFERRGRAMALTPNGQIVRQYAEEIFGLAEQMLETLRGTTTPRHALRFRVGVSEHLPKLVAYQLLASALHIEGQPVHLIVHEGSAEHLVAELAVHRLDLVLSDTPVGLASDVHAEAKLVVESGVVWVGTSALRRRYAEGFPATLQGAPVLLPGSTSAIRKHIEDWLEREKVRPIVVAEVGDSALLKAFGAAGAGMFPVPEIVLAQVQSQYGVERIGVAKSVYERVWAITMPGRASSAPIRAIVDGSVLSKSR